MEQDEPHHGVRQGWFGYLGQLIKGVNLKQDGHFVLDAAHGNILGQVAGWLTSHQVDEADERGDTLLHVAARLRNPFLANLLLANGAEINAQNLEGNTPLHIAVTVGSRPIVRLLVGSHADVNMPNHADETPMHIAMRQRAWLIMTYLIENDARSDMRDAGDNTLLHLAAHDGQLELAQVLVRRDHDIIDAVNGAGDTALHVAVAAGNRPIVKLLIECRANVNVLNHADEAPMHIAMRQRAWYLMTYLIENNARFDIRDTDNNTLLHLAAHAGKLEIAKLLVEKNHSIIDEKNREGDTALHIALRQNQAEVVLLLLSKGANLKLVNRKSDTIFHAAAQSQNDGINMSLLCDPRAKSVLISEVERILFVNLRNDPLEQQRRGDAALHIAARNGLHMAIELLLASRADRRLENDEGLTAYEVASQAGHRSILDSLYIPTYRDSAWGLVKSTGALLQPVVGPVIMGIARQAPRVGPLVRRFEQTAEEHVGAAVMNATYQSLGLPAPRQQVVGILRGGRGFNTVVEQLVDMLFARNKVMKKIAGVGASISNLGCIIS